MEFTRKAQGIEIPKNAQRIFLCWDFKDTGFLDTICTDILYHDVHTTCVVTYFENEEVQIECGTEILQNELLNTKILVILITKDLIENWERNRMPTEFVFAKQHEIPVLPIVQYDSLFPAFTKLADAIHGISKIDTDYHQKLKTQLSGLLASDKFIKEVLEKAFTATLFLSYRRDNLLETKQFMRAFHSIPDHLSVAVWYDNFLTAGRIFDDEIRDSIIKSDAFVLLVTRDLLLPNNEGKPNYIISTEYPEALKLKKKIIAVEVLKIDRKEFKSKFKKVHYYCDNENYSAAFKKILPKKKRGVENEAERNYYLGMAYLKGLYVERDVNKAIKILKTSADCKQNESSLMAQKELSDIYLDGIVIEYVDYEQGLKYQLQAMETCEKIYGTKNKKTAVEYERTGMLYQNNGKHDKALLMFRSALKVYIHLGGEESNDVVNAMRIIGYCYWYMDDRDNMFAMMRGAVGLGSVMSENGTLDEDVSDSLIETKAFMFKEEGNYKDALNVYTDLLRRRVQKYGEESFEAHMVRFSMGTAHIYNKEYNLAISLFNRSLEWEKQYHGPQHTMVGYCCNGLGTCYYNLNRYDDAMDCFLQGLKIASITSGNEAAVIRALDNIKTTYIELGGYEEDADMWFYYNKNETDCYKSVITLYEKLGKFDRAKDIFQQYLTM